MNINTLKPAIKNIAEKYHLSLVLLFGSQVSGPIHKESDIDIAVLPSKNLTFEQEINLAAEFFNISNKIDFTNLRKASPLLLKKIIENCQALYQKNPSDFSVFEIHALNRHHEALPLYKMHFQSIKDFVKI